MQVSAALTSLPLLFSYLTLALFSPPCSLLHLSFYLNLSGRPGRNYLLSPLVLSGYDGSPDTRFSRETTRLMSWPDGERYSHPLQFLVVSLLLSLVPTLYFFGLEEYCLIEMLRNAGSLDFHRGTCAPSSRSLCSFSSTLQQTQPSVKLLSLQDWQNRESFLQSTSHLILHCPATDSFGDSLSVYDLWSGPWRVARLLGLHGLPPCPYPSEGVW